jgi:hypothetical protein
MKSELTSSNGGRLIPVTPGSFVMGSPQTEVGHEYWEGEREVTLSDEFYLGATPVTQRQFDAVMPGFRRQFAHHPAVEDAPVDSVRWQAASEYCTKLTHIDRDAGILDHDWEYRLPTEAEWEYACRAGTSGAIYSPLDSVAWHFGNSNLRPHPVGQKAPNAWGFFDMLGNVWEMCQDWFSLKGQQRACRGGSYFNTRKNCRAAARSFYMGGRYCGFRLAVARVGPCNFSPSIEQYPSAPPKPSIFDAWDTKDYALAEQILANDPDQRDGVDDIPPTLHSCIYTDRAEMVPWLLDHGANIELPEQDYGSTPLNTAVVHRHKRIIRTLVEWGADTTRAMQIAQRGLAGDFEDDASLDREGYRDIIELLRELGVE